MPAQEQEAVVVTLQEQANTEVRSIFIQKFSAMTYPPDCKYVPEEIKEAIQHARHTIGKVWRAKIGRAGKWHYAWDYYTALKLALEAPTKDNEL